MRSLKISGSFLIIFTMIFSISSLEIPDSGAVLDWSGGLLLLGGETWLLPGGDCT